MTPQFRNAGVLKNVALVVMCGVLVLAAADPALAQSSGGFQKANEFIDNVLSILRGVSLGVVTIAIIWAGYKFLFKKADLTEVGMILAGGMLIGGAAELARYLIGTQS